MAAPRVRVYLRTRRLRVARAGPHVKLPIPVRSNVVVTSDALPYEQLFEGRDEPPAYVGLTTAAAQAEPNLTDIRRGLSTRSMAVGSEWTIDPDG